ncbi:hypothetical protein Q4601_03945 [Shewanella sp. 1_MG-2023]|uniref:hypothetical protein n=1 Tax=unclassified Shewanella TaxID=196818 RepID=UPI0026E1707D|nr:MULTISPECIES: hypothetical protein [unclassified Shewanella]MDO6610843.1 hypothetical protein [Shewanella sp. 7_MG-2023]MDO6770306.1 hypothetical protein [Shewanella sp. 2_MG-2023]MDO6793447.1 hypothetical protein [Shewanella sp. 1_MG-2023]
MKFNLKALPLAISVAMLPAYVVAEETNDEKIAKLEQQVQSLQASQTASLTERFSFNGFMTGAYITSDNNAGYAGATTSANFDDGSKFGLQGTFAITDQTQAVMQLMMRGENDWDVEAEWAYVSHRFDSGLQARAGKLRVPLFMYSDYLDVGYAQPFVRPPSEVYDAVPFTSYTGGDVSYDVEFDDSTLTFQAFGGQSEDSGIDIKNILGANVNWTDETWTLRAVYGQATLDGDVTRQVKQELAPGADVDVTVTLLEMNNEDATFAGVGASYDNGSFLAIAEWTRIEVDGIYPDSDSGYLTLGYRINAFTPYVTAAFYETKDNDTRKVIDETSAIHAAIFNGERTSYSAGLRWDALDNLAVKFDVTYSTDFGDTSGGLDSNIAQEFDDTTVYTVQFDVVF